jgi:hypothetical protein
MSLKKHFSVFKALFSEMSKVAHLVIPIALYKVNQLNSYMMISLLILIYKVAPLGLVALL